MAIMLVRNKISPEGMRGFTSDNDLDGEGREEMVRTALSAIGVELKQVYFSGGDGSAVLIVEGDAEKIPVLEAWAMSTGAFSSTQAEVLIPLKEFVRAAKSVGKVYDLYDAPNRDEIDRMLLDE
ncbi:MAG: hypothetical protein VXY90_10270 [Pseudomonadota bacterium]|jgi:uncharacterized protein with GYD domain|nr:hypothetical protein [Pseudomonadota bacterium]MEC8676108.1 hypothetical protein [Pseudomonadota bacterium]